jgi:hypothetical protein
VPKEILYVLFGVLVLGFILVCEKHGEETLDLEKALVEERGRDSGYKKKFEEAMLEVDQLKSEVEKSQATLKQCVKEVETCGSVQYVSHALRIKR